MSDSVDPMDCSLPGFSVHGILQARTLEWVAISFSSAWKWKVKVKLLSHVRLLATPWTAAYQAPPSMGFSGQQYWSGVTLPSPCMKRYIFINHFICMAFLKRQTLVMENGLLFARCWVEGRVGLKRHSKGNCFEDLFVLIIVVLKFVELYTCKQTHNSILSYVNFF